MTWLPKGRKRIFIDDNYEAFPAATRTDDGTIVVSWAHYESHYGPGSAYVTWSHDGGQSWAEPVLVDDSAELVSAAAIASWGNTVAILVNARVGSVRHAHIATATTSDLSSWSHGPRIMPDPAPWTYPCDLMWYSADEMVATFYSPIGVVVQHSDDAGQTWEHRSIAVASTAWQQNTEAAITDLGTQWVMVLRHDVSDTISQLFSSDQGMTWSTPQTILTQASGMPRMTVMFDGAWLLPYRDMRQDGTPQSWALAQSMDQGVTWVTSEISDGWMMYGQVLALEDTAGLLIGASQARSGSTDYGSTTDADLWILRLSHSSVEIPHIVSAGTVRMQITVSTADIGRDMTIVATASGGVPRIVRGWDATPAPSIAIVVDHEAELNTAILYTVLIDGVEVDSLTVTVPSEMPLITDPIYGRHIPVIIQSWPERTHERAGQVLHAAGRREPIVIDGLELAPSSTITLISADPNRARDLERMIADRSVVRVRPACGDLPTDWVSARDRSRRRFSRRAESATVDEISLAHTGQPEPGTPAVANSLAELDAYVTARLGHPGTLSDIAEIWPGTLADIALTDLTA